jgi:hypothetical protein
MTDNEAWDILCAQGHAAGIPDLNGWVRVWIHGSNDSVDVKVGRELRELAEGKLCFDEVHELRISEIPVGR